MPTTQIDPARAADRLAIADEDDIITGVRRHDLLAAVGFLSDTITSHGTEDVAEWLRGVWGDSQVDDDDVRALAVRLTALREAIR